MTRETIREYFNAIYNRYQKASIALKLLILDEFCLNAAFNRGYAILRFNIFTLKGLEGTP